MEALFPIKWQEDKLLVLDQLLLPGRVTYIDVCSVKGCYDVIKNMNVRGAPLIGFTAIYGMVFAADESETKEDFIRHIEYLKTARPTAVNLEFEVNELREKIDNEFSSFDRMLYKNFILKVASEKQAYLENCNLQAAHFAISDLEENNSNKNYNVITICNTGRLACGPLGTALGVITTLNKQGKLGKVFCCETRPYLQGSRLTSLELTSEGIDHQIIVEGAISHVLKNESIDAIFVGADRIASNGDTANKVGTSTLAIVAKYYDVPFYVVAPTSSFDLSLKSGREIIVEYRSEEEVTRISDKLIAPESARAYNPSFDVTKADLISGIVCEKKCFKYPFSFTKDWL